MPVALERSALALLGEVIGLLDLEEFCYGLLRTLREAIPAEFCALNEVPAELPHTISITDPPVPAQIHHAFARYAPQNPIANHFLTTGDGRATRFSDLVTRRQLHRLELYREVYRPLSVEHQIAFTLPSRTERILGVALSRAKQDFTTRDRDLLNLTRPYLIQAYRNALAHTSLAQDGPSQLAVSDLQSLGLTRRQAEVLRLIAMGHSSEAAAATLAISARTVQKHLEHCYQTLNVNTRSAAAQRAWTAAGNH